jgi:hypothetical protein
MTTEKGTGSKIINRPHWKAIAESQSATIAKLESEVARLRANGADGADLARIKADAFAAGVASVSSYVAKL